MKATTGIRWPDELRARIEEAAKIDSRTFSDEVRELVKLGLKRRKIPSTSQGGAA